VQQIGEPKWASTFGQIQRFQCDIAEHFWPCETRCPLRLSRNVFRSEVGAQLITFVEFLWCPEGDLVFEAFDTVSNLLIPRQAKQARNDKNAGHRHILGTRPKRVPERREWPRFAFQTRMQAEPRS
jgi:hypothetical protein